MAVIWLGDFRTKQLQFINAEDVSTGDVYFTDDAAEYTWLESTAYAQLPNIYSSKADIVIALGFNDCVYSCTWNAFNIDTIAENYVTAINNLAELYKESNFYVCSVGPVDDNYPFAQYKNGGIIDKKTLNNKISVFNTKLQIGCNATFVDCWDYLNKTSFSTRDGVRYTNDTCNMLQEFIRSNIKVVAHSNSLLGRLRATEDDAPKDTESSFKYWQKPLNQCIEIRNSCVLPNCVGYAWGRFYEIIGETPKLSTGNAGTWFGHTADGYERSKSIDEFPKVGAVICWGKQGAAGHVGIVESVDQATGVIITSESGYDEKAYDPVTDFWITHRAYDKETKNWRAVAAGDDKNTIISSWIDSYDFQGFIYPPQTVISKENLCTKNSYGITRDEMKPNVQYIWQYFGSRGWTLNAVAGMLGNIEQESKMSPCVWENVYTDCETINTSTGVHTLTNKGKSFKHGYGLTQWTPATKFFTWCDNGGKGGNQNGTGGKLNYWEIDTQLQRIEAEVKASTGGWIEGLSQWIAKPSKGYDLTFNEFISSDKDAAWLAAAFAFCYERPARSTGTAEEQAALKKERGDNATFWFDYLQGLSPVALEEKTSKLSSFKVDKHEAKKADFSFYAHNCVSGSYIIYEGNTKITEGKIAEVKDGTNIVPVTSNKILPGKSYKLKLTVKGNSEESLERETTFKVPQSLPNSVKSITLVCKDALKDTNSAYDLSVTAPANLGYWGSNTCGYDEILIVNSKHIKTKTILGTQNYNKNAFTLKQEFDYEPKVGDIIQIGFRVWATDNNGTKHYDSENPKTSAAICLLNKPVTACLNIN